jgi:diaminohydroxyphosphoribosylaminopyrimidine deaminase/5-amino-6-(5-phosphoribosylamino)uracil reductase
MLSLMARERGGVYGVAMVPSDSDWMARALELAERGRGHVEPNPLVGAVVVHACQVVGEGWHARFGQAHAEVNALEQAGAAAKGADLYVTLEPCCHHGKTPPCTDAIIRSGIARVIVAMSDPNPLVGGKGVQLLQAAGLMVATGICQAEAQRQNAPYLKLMATGMPYVHLKWAMTLDGKIATRTGESRWISNDQARQRVHVLRGRMDAILVGVGTALADDPLLTARPPGPRTACRIVLDSRGRLPADCQLARTAASVPLLMVTSTAASLAWAEGLRRLGVEVFVQPTVAGKQDITALLSELGKRQMTNLLVEGGARVLGSFQEAGQVDEVHVYIAPKLIGGEEAPGPIAGLGIDRLADALKLSGWEIEQVGDNVLIHAWK